MVYVFAICSETGEFRCLLTLKEEEVISMDRGENEHGVQSMEYANPDSEIEVEYYLEYTKINNSL